MSSKNYDIHERMFNFIVEVISFVNSIPKTATNLIFINQIIRSVSSIGANSQEADGALTNKDFIHGFTIVRKESKETIFWLRLIAKTNQKLIPNTDKLLQEGGEIVAIVSTIIKNASNSTKERK